jgi:hypothetical protein
MYQSGVPIIVYVSIRGINHIVCINHVYTMIDPPGWYIRYDWYPWLIHTQSETSTMIDAYTMSDTFTMIDTYTMIDPPGWYIHYYQSGISIIVYVSIRGTNHSVCINQGYQSYCVYQSRDTPDWYIHYDWYPWLIYTLWLIPLIDAYTMIDICTKIILPDWYIHYE